MKILPSLLISISIIISTFIFTERHNRFSFYVQGASVLKYDNVKGDVYLLLQESDNRYSYQQNGFVVIPHNATSDRKVRFLPDNKNSLDLQPVKK